MDEQHKAMKKLLLLAAFSLCMIFTAVCSTSGQVDTQKVITHDFLIGEVYNPVDTVIFAEKDSLIIGEMVRLEAENGETQIQLHVIHGEKTSHFFIFVSNKKLRVAQEKVFEEGSDQPKENVVYFPLGKGKLRMLNYNTSVEMTNAQKAEHFGLIIAFVEEKYDLKIRY